MCSTTSSDLVDSSSNSLNSSTAVDPSPQEIRAQILSDHEALRSLFDRIELLATRVVMKFDPDVTLLRNLALEMCETFRAHVQYEIEMLRPALLNLDPWGEERVEVLDSDHALQLSQLALFEKRLGDPREHPHMLAMLVLGCLVRLRDDMEDEERMMICEAELYDGWIQRSQSSGDRSVEEGASEAEPRSAHSTHGTANSTPDSKSDLQRD